MKNEYSEKVFINCDVFIKILISHLEQLSSELNKKGYSNQTKMDIQSGLIKRNGILISLVNNDYRILFDHYDILILNTFIKFIKDLMGNTDNPLIPFSFRTIQEIGFTKIDVLFSKNTTINKKQKVILLALLVDYMVMPDSLHRNHYQQLLMENKYLLDKKDIDLFDRVLENKFNVEISEIKKIRNRVSNEFMSLQANAEKINGINYANLKQTYAWFSHLLHGNPFLLVNMFNSNQSWREKYRLYSIVLLASINVLNRVTNYLDYKSMEYNIIEINEEFNSLFNLLKKDWEQASANNKIL